MRSVGLQHLRFWMPTSNALDVIHAMTNKEAVPDYSPEAVEAILGAFNDRGG